METYRTILVTFIFVFVLGISIDIRNTIKALTIIALKQQSPNKVAEELSKADSMYIDSGFIYKRVDSGVVAAFPVKDYAIIKRTH